MRASQKKYIRLGKRVILNPFIEVNSFCLSTSMVDSEQPVFNIDESKIEQRTDAQRHHDDSIIFLSDDIDIKKWM